MFSVASTRRRAFNQAMNGFFLLAITAAAVMPFGKTSTVQWGSFGLSTFCIAAFAMMYAWNKFKHRKGN